MTSCMGLLFFVITPKFFLSNSAYSISAYMYILRYRKKISGECCNVQVAFKQRRTVLTDVLMYILYFLSDPRDRDRIRATFPQASSAPESFPPPPFPLCRALAAKSRAPAPAASPVATLLPAGCCISPSMAFPPSPLLPSSSYSSFFSRPNSHPSPPARTPFPAASPSPL